MTTDFMFAWQWDAIGCVTPASCLCITREILILYKMRICFRLTSDKEWEFFPNTKLKMPPPYWHGQRRRLSSPRTDRPLSRDGQMTCPNKIKQAASNGEELRWYWFIPLMKDLWQAQRPAPTCWVRNWIFDGPEKKGNPLNLGEGS